MVCVYVCVCGDFDNSTHTWYRYGVAMISRLLKITGLFGTIVSLLEGSFAKETYNFKEPTNRSHPIYMCVRVRGCEHVCVHTQTFV